jgi:poly(A) polymerase
MKPHHLGKKDVTEKTLRRFIREVGDETIDAILDLAEADELGALPNRNMVPDLRKRIEDIRKAPVKMKKKPTLDGNEIMGILKIKMGPEVGKALEYIKDLEDEYASQGKELTKEEATKAIREKF